MTPFVPRFDYGIGGTAVSWTATLPSRAWLKRTREVGGSRTSAGGVPAAYVVRRDHVLAVAVRIYEEEWPDLQGLVEWGQFGESFLYYPDSAGGVIAAARAVWLEFPKAPEEIAPEPLADYPRALEQTLELRSVDGQPWTIEYYAEPLA